MWIARNFRRMDFECRIPSRVLELIITHLFAFLRCYLIFVLLQQVQITEVVSEASIREKQWVTTTIGIFLAFFALSWIVQIVLSIMSVNVNGVAAFGFIVYAFGSFMEEFVEHLISGIQLNSDLPDELIIYDSLFIHNIRLIILWGTGLFLLLFCVLCCGYVLLHEILLQIRRSYRLNNN